MTSDVQPKILSSKTTYQRGPHWVALLAAALTLPLLFVGGSVTSYGVGMAVPDWPTTFGMNMFLYNFWNDSLGVKLEHTHRLYGVGVGLATLFLTVWFLAFERRRYMKVLGVVALAAVIAQGIMGGLRVNQISTFFAAVHGCFGQAFFGLMVALCVLTSRSWLEPSNSAADIDGIRWQSGALLAFIYGQVVVGAWFRHFRTPFALVTHIALALILWSFAFVIIVQVRRRRIQIPTLLSSARSLGMFITFQVVLGIIALWLMLPLGGNPRSPSLWQAMLRTAHQTNGAILLASSIVLCLRSFQIHRLMKPYKSPSPTLGDSASRKWEAVA